MGDPCQTHRFRCFWAQAFFSPCFHFIPPPWAATSRPAACFVLPMKFVVSAVGTHPMMGWLQRGGGCVLGRRLLFLLLTAFSCTSSHVNRLGQTDGAHSHDLSSLRCSRVRRICFLVYPLYFYITYFFIFHDHLMVPSSSFSSFFFKMDPQEKSQLQAAPLSQGCGLLLLHSRIFMFPLQLSWRMQRYLQYLLMATRFWVQFLFGLSACSPGPVWVYSTWEMTSKMHFLPILLSPWPFSLIPQSCFLALDELRRFNSHCTLIAH